MHLPLPLLLLAAPLLSSATASAIPSSSSLVSPPTDDPSLALTRPDLPDTYTNRVLLIRHGEKPKDGSEGLSKPGRKRAQCLRKVMGRNGKHNIGLIIAQSYNHKTGTRARPYLTVKPLARDLGLPVHTDCERDDPLCVRDIVAKFAQHSKKDVLVCWKHSFLKTVAHSLGSRARLAYPDDRFDIMWIMKNHRIISKESEQCRNLDDARRYDPDLEVEQDDERDAGLLWNDAEEEDDDDDAEPNELWEDAVEELSGEEFGEWAGEASSEQIPLGL